MTPWRTGWRLANFAGRLAERAGPAACVHHVPHLHPPHSTHPTAPKHAPLLARTQLAARRKAQDNMSKEMKQRLRKEYVGMGGTPNQVRVWRWWPIDGRRIGCPKSLRARTRRYGERRAQTGSVVLESNTALSARAREKEKKARKRTARPHKRVPERGGRTGRRAGRLAGARVGVRVWVCVRTRATPCAPPKPPPPPPTPARPAARRPHPRVQAMSSNYFLWIIVGISALAVASKLSGAI